MASKINATERIAIIIEKQKIEVVTTLNYDMSIEFVNENRENLFEMAGFKGALE
ncbi:phage protein [Streptococcus pneumoniae]|nr:phage protein [Streptococcus pneumoniae]